MIDPSKVCLFIPPGLKKFKLDLFERIGQKIGRVVRDKYDQMDRLPDDIIPIVGCTPQFRPYIEKWRARGRTWIYWDRGYARRVFATWLPTGHDLGIPGGYYRWHINTFQMDRVRDVPDDRWRFLELKVQPWKRSGDHIVITHVGPDYWNLHADLAWCDRTAAELRHYTDREIRIRDKESKVPLYVELADAHCLVSHGSIAAVESVIMGCPVFVTEASAAKFMGRTDFSKIEEPVYPEREKWLHALAYHQWNEDELTNGTLWRMIT